MLSDLEHAKVQFSFSTNGIVIRKSFLDLIMNLQHLVHVNVSVDSPDADLYRKLRGADIGKVLRSVQRLAECGGKFVLTVSSLAMKENVSTFKLFPPVLSAIGVHNYVVQSFADQSPHDRNSDLYRNNQAGSEIEQLKEAAKASNVDLHFESPARIAAEITGVGANPAVHDYFLDVRLNKSAEKQSRACPLPWESVHVDANGSVFPCCRAGAESKSRLGHLEKETIESIWMNTAYTEFRNSLLLKDGRTCPEVCATCSVYPAGLPPTADYSAALVTISRRTAYVEVVFRNMGTRSWTLSEQPLIGTAHPRDRASATFHKTWLSTNRAARPRETCVSPGELAHYRFRLGRQPEETIEEFQLVVDGVLWIPNTNFVIPGAEKSFLKRGWNFAAQRLAPRS
jgi:radical SAM protein with 4Fe4S-binding SPASM domain